LSGLIRRVSWPLFVVAGLVLGMALGQVLRRLPAFAHFGEVAMLCPLGGAVMGYVIGRAGARVTIASTVHGSASFATERQIQASLGAGEGLIVGRENRRHGRLLRYSGPAHLLTIAPTRSGKGVGAIIPNLLTAERSILCIDPKGENARIAARARHRLGPVHILDPFGVSGAPTAAFNPLDALNPESLDLAEDAALVADALVYDPPGQIGEAHWNEEAKALIGGLILHVVTDPGQPSNLATVRDLLTLAPDKFYDLLRAMQQSPAAGGLVARAANRHLGKSEREATSVLSSAQRHTHFLDSQRMVQVLSRSDFRFEDLKAGTATVFLVLPPERLATHARWLRLLVAQAINAMARSPIRPAAPVLFLLDEFAALGRLEPVERAFGLMAGYGLQLWPILQDKHQFWNVYGDRAGTFIANAGVIQVFNVADVETASWVSKSIGATTVTYQTSGTSVSNSPGRFLLNQTTKGVSTSVHRNWCERPTCSGTV